MVALTLAASSSARQVRTVSGVMSLRSLSPRAGAMCFQLSHRYRSTVRGPQVWPVVDSFGDVASESDTTSVRVTSGSTGDVGFDSGEPALGIGPGGEGAGYGSLPRARSQDRGSERTGACGHGRISVASLGQVTGSSLGAGLV
jgi:hypothetical protein